MNKLRTYIQSNLNEITNIDSGYPIADDVIENGKTYFGYELQENYVSSDFDKNYYMHVTLIGRIVRKNNQEENTLLIIDNALKSIKEKFKSMNIKYSYKDITLDDVYKKIQVTGDFYYNDNNNKIIV